MGVRPEFRWLLLTLLAVGALLGISALALNRPDVVWEARAAAGEAPPVVALCPHCRSGVNAYSRRCRACREEFDWTATPHAASPLSRWSLSSLEDEWLRGRVRELGEEEAVRRTAEALGVTDEAAQAWLGQVGRGRCGWCGGTGRDPPGATNADPCPVCFGQRQCLACGGDRHVRVGDPGAGAALEALLGEWTSFHRLLPRDVQREAARQLASEFARRHAGTWEATRLPFWREVADAGSLPRAAVAAARERLDRVLVHLAAP
jgi:hypothetical protein